MEILNDILQYKNLKIYQNTDFFCFSLDSIVLANYSPIRLKDKKIVDFCTGNGIVPIILSNRCKCKIIGLEVQNSIADLARKSILYNKLEDNVEIICTDVKDFCKNYNNEFDLVTCNPPYFKLYESSNTNISIEKKIARHEVKITFDEICYNASKILKENGNFCFVHRCDRFIEIIFTLKKYHLEPKNVKFIYDSIDKEPALFFMQSKKCGSVGLKFMKPLILHDSDNKVSYDYKKLMEEIF